MNEFSLYLIPSLICYFFYYLYSVRRTGFFSLDNLFILANIIMIQGILSMLDPDLDADRMHAKVLIYSLPLFISSATVGEALFNNFKSVSKVSIKIMKPSKLTIYFIVISTLIMVMYYQSVGYSVFFLGIASIFSGSDYDIATLRLDSYAGNKYLFPGYVNQFKNVLLPGLSIIYLTYSFTNKIKNRFILLILLGFLSLSGLLGTGQRGAFVISMITIIAFTYFLNKTTFRKLAPLVLALAIPIFFLSSAILDRNNTKSSLSSDPIYAVTTLSTELYNRIFRDNQISAVYGFRYVAYLDTQHGGEWNQNIIGILPGDNFRGSNLAGKIYEVIYGTDRGTMPIGIWGSVFYNFGIIGTIIFPIMLGLIYKYIYSRFSNMRVMNQGELFAMAGIFVTMGLWIADGPVTMLNTGLPGYILIYIISRWNRIGE